MHLRNYLEQAEISASVFAKRIGVTRMQVWRYLNGGAIPRSDVMARIADMSGGIVTANDFFSPPSLPVDAVGEIAQFGGHLVGDSTLASGLDECLQILDDPLAIRDRIERENPQFCNAAFAATMHIGGNHG